MSSHGVSVRLSLARLHNGKVVETDQAMNDSPGKTTNTLPPSLNELYKHLTGGCGSSRTDSASLPADAESGLGIDAGRGESLDKLQGGVRREVLEHVVAWSGFRDQTLDKPEVLPVVSCCRRQVLQAHKDIEKRGDVRSGCEELVRDPFVSTKNALALEVASPSTRRETGEAVEYEVE
ncbi:hypothetical protein B0O80DRAFT_422900 [Mortierella sp. GBAus27b]|nr:hypothetical protein B0O80DRAFT_422900 [Mortierella sp. GBAus27b]